MGKKEQVVGNKSMQAKSLEGLGWKFPLIARTLSVVLYKAEAVLLMGYHPQRQGGKVQAVEIKAVTAD